MLDDREREKVLTSINLVDLVTEDTPCKKTHGDHAWFNCPFHQEKTPSFAVRISRQSYHCFGCGKSGDAITYYRESKGMSFMEAVKALADKGHVILHYSDEPEEQRDTQAALKASMKVAYKHATDYFAAVFKSEEGKQAREYALSRWNDPRFLDEYQIGYAPNNWQGFIQYAEEHSLSLDVLEQARLVTRSKKTGQLHDFFVNRLMIPIRNHYGEVIGFSARTMEPAKLPDGSKNPNAEPKYINTANYLLYDKDHTLFGLDYAWRQTQKEGNCYCLEGAPDAMRLHLLKITNAVACLGADWTENQLKLLRRYTSSITFIPDTDEPKFGEKLGIGFQKVIRAGLLALKMGFSVSVKEIPSSDGKEDADSYFVNKTKFSSTRVHDFLPWYAGKLLEEGKSESQVMQEIAKVLVYRDSQLELDTAIDQLKSALGTKRLWNTALQEAKTAKAQKDADEKASKEAVSLELMKKYGFQQHRDNYYFELVGDKMVQWSNFVMKPLFHVRDDNSQSLRIFEITNEFGQSQIIELKQEDLITLSRFKLKAESLGNYVWQAKDEQLTRLKRYLYKETRTADLITQLGWQKNAGFFAWGNGAYFNGVWFPTDEYGIVHLPSEAAADNPYFNLENNYYFPAFSSVYTRDKGLFNFERRFIYQPTQDISLRNYSEKIIAVFGNNGMEGLAFLIATLFRDVITRETKTFPILNIFGPKGSGKSELGHSLMAFFVAGNTPPNIQNSTIPALSDAVAQCANALVHIDEFKDTIDVDKREFLKGLWDGVGRNRMNMDKDKKREQTRVDSGIILTGQEMATADIALFSRFIFLSFGKTEFTPQAKRLFQDLADTRKLGVSHLTHQILKHRAFFEANFRAAYEMACNDLFSALKNDGIEDRIIRNWIIPLAAFGTLNSKLDFPFNYEQLKQFSISGVRNQQSECSSNNEVAGFWFALSAMRGTGEFYEGSVYRIDSVSKLTTYDKGKQNWESPRLVLRLRVKSTLSAYSLYLKRTGIKGLVQNSILFYLKSDHRCYLGLQNSCKFDDRVAGVLQTTADNGAVKVKKVTDQALCFDYEAIKKTYNVFFTDDGSDDENESICDSYESDLA